MRLGCSRRTAAPHPQLTHIFGLLTPQSKTQQVTLMGLLVLGALTFTKELLEVRTHVRTALVGELRGMKPEIAGRHINGGQHTSVAYGATSRARNRADARLGSSTNQNTDANGELVHDARGSSLSPAPPAPSTSISTSLAAVLNIHPPSSEILGDDVDARTHGARVEHIRRGGGWEAAAARLARGLPLRVAAIGSSVLGVHGGCTEAAAALRGACDPPCCGAGKFGGESQASRGVGWLRRAIDWLDDEFPVLNRTKDGGEEVPHSGGHRLVNVGTPGGSASLFAPCLRKWIPHPEKARTHTRGSGCWMCILSHTLTAKR